MVKLTLKWIGGILLSITILYFILGFTGIIDLQFSKYFGVQQANVNREIYKENKTYREGMASDLAKYKYELTTEKDTVARKAIVSLIRNKFADFDVEKLESSDLRSFLRDIKGGKYNE